MYADDVVVYSSSSTTSALSKTLNITLSKIHDWSDSNGMIINVAKTNAILINKSKQSSLDWELSINNTILTTVSQTKHLGISFNDKLSFSNQVDITISRLNYGLHLLRQASKTVSNRILIMLYNAYCNPFLIYCISAYGTHISTTDLERIDKVRLEIARTLSYPLHFDSRKLYFDYLNWLSMRSMIKYHVVIAVYQSINNLTPKYCSYYRKVATNTRAATSFNLAPTSIPKHEFAVNNISYQGVLIWNKLPFEVRICSDLKLFKRLSYRHFHTTDDD
jgi:hypothetical protein